MSSLRSSPIFFAALVAGCEPQPPPTVAAQEPAIAPGPSSIVLNEPAEIEPAFVYSPVGRKDPFRAVAIDDPSERAIGPLQLFELEQLKLIAVVTGVASPYAMVEDPEGVGHVVRRGDLIGKHWGRVQTVSKRALVIREERPTFKQGKTIELTRLEMTEAKLPYTLARSD